jgi:hypothetical protein
VGDAILFGRDGVGNFRVDPLSAPVQSNTTRSSFLTHGHLLPCGRGCIRLRLLCWEGEHTVEAKTGQADHKTDRDNHEDPTSESHGSVLLVAWGQAAVKIEPDLAPALLAETGEPR